jgi:hypothetical protein
MSKIIRHTNLASEQPGPRADVDLPLEGINFESREQAGRRPLDGAGRSEDFEALEFGVAALLDVD